MLKKHYGGICVGMLLSAAVVNDVAAHEQGDWLFRFGASNADPKSNNHEIVSVEDATSLTLNFRYMFTDHWSFEVLAAYPFEHDIELVTGEEVGSTKHLPPTFSLQYHFLPQAKFQPYVGVGVNYTNFFSEKTTGPLEGTNLSLDDSWGFAFELGVDIPLNDKWFLNLDYRYIDIETDAKLDGADLGTVKIDPNVFGVHVGFSF